MKPEILFLLKVLKNGPLLQRDTDYVDKRAAFGAADGVRIDATTAMDAIQQGYAAISLFPEGAWAFTWLYLTEQGKTALAEEEGKSPELLDNDEGNAL